MAGKRKNYNVSPGQLVAYVYDSAAGTYRTKDATNLTAADIPELFIGVGHDSTGRGITDSIRHIGIEDISGCDLDETSVSSPQCGAPQIMDFFFDCTECAETYSLMVRVDDNRTRSFSPFNKSWAEYVGSIVTECPSCDDCPQDHNCDEIACKLADALNQERDLMILDEPYPDWKGGGGFARPFHVTKLHERSLVYCLSANDPDGECENCTQYDAITRLNHTSDLGAVTTTDLVGTTDPRNSANTLRGQLQSVADQINQMFEDNQGRHSGSAYITGNEMNRCCPLQLHVNTCDANFSIDGLTPVETNPFDQNAKTIDPHCQDCDSNATTNNLNCGIRVIAAPIEASCDCFINKPLAFYGRKIDVRPVGDIKERGFKNGFWKTEEIQSMTLPAGFGSAIQWSEYQNVPEGQGRRYSRSNNNQGWLNLPDSVSRVRKAVTAKCDEDYCSWWIKSYKSKERLNNQLGRFAISSTIHIPSSDSTTVASWQAFYEALINLNPNCKQLSPGTCTPLATACP